jgi:hypothetical protein
MAETREITIANQIETAFQELKILVKKTEKPFSENEKRAAGETANMDSFQSVSNSRGYVC